MEERKSYMSTTVELNYFSSYLANEKNKTKKNNVMVAAFQSQR